VVQYDICWQKQRSSNEPQVHYGLIASGNQVMKHGLTRGILGFETGAAGLMSTSRVDEPTAMPGDPWNM
jgi:hypothetical protein